MLLIVTDWVAEAVSNGVVKLSEVGDKVAIGSVLVGLMQWGDTYAAGPDGPPVTLRHRDCGQPVHLQLSCQAGHVLESAREVSPVPGPGARKVASFAPDLVQSTEHHLCPGCGEPAAMRSSVEMIEELGFANNSIAVFGIGCYTSFSSGMDIEVLQALHGRVESVASGTQAALAAPVQVNE